MTHHHWFLLLTKKDVLAVVHAKTCAQHVHSLQYTLKDTKTKGGANYETDKQTIILKDIRHGHRCRSNSHHNRL